MTSSRTRSGRCCFHRGQRLLAVGGLQRRIAMRLEPRHEDVAVDLVVVDDEDAWGIVHGYQESVISGQYSDHFISLITDSCLWHVFPDLCQEGSRTVRLGDVGVAARRPRLGLVAAQRIGRDRDDRDCAQRRIGLEAARNLVAVEQRQLDVHQDQVRPLRRCGGERLHAVLGQDDLVSDAGEQVAQDPLVVRLILDHQDAPAHTRPSCCSTRTGSVKEKVDPLPGINSTQIRPLCISMIRFAIDNPSPVPPLAFVDELSACWNSSKILAWSAVLIPGPESQTATVNEPLVADALTATSPVVRELDRVADQVQQDLRDATLVAASRRQMRGYVGLEREVLSGRQRLERDDHAVDDLLERIVGERQA